MTFSEFGRRIDENRQMGTDHGTANVMFLMGGKVLAGLHGEVPNLANLDPQGDLCFRPISGRYMRASSAIGSTPIRGRILENDFRPMALVRA